jgi:AcrR family transcriptional regulator
VSAPREPDPNRRSERAHAAILEATRELIVEVGYDSMSIEGIAGRAGVGKQTIYRWWPSKAALVLDMWTPDVAEKLSFPDTGDLADDLTSQIAAVIGIVEDPVFSSSFRALVAESQHDETLSAQMRQRIFDPRIDACKERLRKAQEVGQLAADVDLDIAVDLFYGGFYHRYLLRVAPLTRAHAGQIVKAALSGVGPPKPDTTRDTTLA